MTARRKSLLDPADSRWDREITHVREPGAEPSTWTHYNRDDIRRHLMSARLLEQLLKRAEAEDLPAMSTWLVTPWSVVGEIHPVGGPHPIVCREAFMVWVHALGGDWRERTDELGQVELTGSAKLPAPGAPHLDVHVGLVAKWWKDDENAAEPVTVPADAAGQPE
jgi:hypothetical protein